MRCAEFIRMISIQAVSRTVQNPKLRQITTLICEEQAGAVVAATVADFPTCAAPGPRARPQLLSAAACPGTPASEPTRRQRALRSRVPQNSELMQIRRECTRLEAQVGYLALGTRPRYNAVQLAQNDGVKRQLTQAHSRADALVDVTLYVALATEFNCSATACASCRNRSARTRSRCSSSPNRHRRLACLASTCIFAERRAEGPDRSATSQPLLLPPPLSTCARVFDARPH